jgi:excisionase family DNA binding protein
MAESYVFGQDVKEEKKGEKDIRQIINISFDPKVQTAFTRVSFVFPNNKILYVVEYVIIADNPRRNSSKIRYTNLIILFFDVFPFKEMYNVYYKMISISELSKELGIHAGTLRRWEKEGKIEADRTAGNQRRYTKETVKKFKRIKGKRKSEIIYCRVSTRKQEKDLERQIKFMQTKFPNFEVISDIGSGINFKRPGLQKLLERLCNGEIKTIAVSFKDRLVRIGFGIFEQLFKIFRCEIISVHNSKTSPDRELVEDLLAITTSYSARIHGLRKYKNQMLNDQVIKEEIREDVEDLDKTK